MINIYISMFLEGKKKIINGRAGALFVSSVDEIWIFFVFIFMTIARVVQFLLTNNR